MTPTLEKARILIADDEASIRIGCERILTAEGHEVTVAEDGMIALRKFEERPFDLVLLDLMMPEMDGLTLIPELMKRDPSTVIIMITGYASFETAVKAIQSGAYDYVPKPFTPSELKIVVQRALEKRYLLLETRRLQEERERSLKDLALEQSRTRSIINAMNDALIVVNSQKEVVLFNPAARMFLKDLQNPIGGPLAGLTDWQELIAKTEESFAKLSPSLRALTVEIDHPERRQTFLMDVAGIPDEEDPLGPWRGAVLVLSDITPLKDLERAKSKFVSIVAHELKAPVAAIEGYIDLILSDLEEAMNKYRQKLERCRDRAGNLQKMIRELLDLSRIEQGRIERTLEILEPEPILSELCEFFKADAAKKKVAIDFTGAAVPPRIRGDKGELGQIFTNFISNAIKYNKEQGNVTVKSECAGEFWKVTVADTGIGIAEQHVKHLGEEFFRVKSAETVTISGTGLGISIVKKLLDMNHARMEIASVKGEGTTVTVSWLLEP
jgi:signal transduction histidine kinase